MPDDERPTTPEEAEPTEPEGPRDRPRASASAPLPERIGPYRIRGVIASGGMGTVYQAVQEKPRRTVALKVIRHGIASRSAMRRFEFEAQILARLTHPGIAQVYEAGTHVDATGERVPFFAMEYIPNAKTLTDYADARKLNTRERLELFARVCDAVSHGHQRGIIHRDLKPGNILVDSSGQPKVIDFGVARATDSDMALTTLQTDVGAILGTPQYMSPEQCDADPNDIDIRSDVYALGVVLYELLCGRLPYDLTRVMLHEAMRVIREQSPTRPSIVDQRLRGDVETIVLKALEKDRDRRYDSAAGFAADLRRYLKDEPIVARPASVGYQLRMFARRNRGVAIAVSAVIAALLVAVTGTTWGLVAARRAQRSEADQRAQAETQRAAADEERKRARKAQQEAEVQAYLARIGAAHSALRQEDLVEAAEQLRSIPENLQTWERSYLAGQLDRSSGTIERVTGARFTTRDGITALSGFQRDVASPLGRASDDPQRHWALRHWDLATLQPLAPGTRPEWADGMERPLAISADRTRVVQCSADALVVVEIETGNAPLRVESACQSLAETVLSPDGRWLLTGTGSGLEVWSVDRGALEKTLELRGETEVWLRLDQGSGFLASEWAMLFHRELAFSADGTRFAATSTPAPSTKTGTLDAAEGAVGIWRASSWDPILQVRTGQRRGGRELTALDGAGTHAASTFGEDIRIWDAHTGVRRATVDPRGHVPYSLALSTDGSQLAVGTADGVVLLAATASAEVTELRGHSRRAVATVAFSPDGSLLTSEDEGGVLKLWATSSALTLGRLRPRGQLVSSVSPRFPLAQLGDQLMSPGLELDGDATLRVDGSATLLALTDRGAELWDLRSRALRRQVSLTAYGEDWRVAAAAEAPRVVSAGLITDRTRGVSEGSPITRRVEARVRDYQSDREVAVLTAPLRKRLVSLAVSGDGQFVAAGGWDGDVVVWSLDRPRDVRRLAAEGPVVSIAFRRDSSLVATGGRSVGIWRVASGERLGVQEITGEVSSLQFTPDGSRLVVASLSGELTILESEPVRSLRALRAHSGAVTSIALHPDGTRLATGGADAEVRIWDLARLEPVLTLREHRGAIGQMAFSRDGSLLVSSSTEESFLRIWDGRPNADRPPQQQR